MTFASTTLHTDCFGALRVKVFDLDFASVTSGSVATGLSKIIHADFTNKTGVTADQAMDWTTTAGTVAITGVTASDKGTLMVFGFE